MTKCKRNFPNNYLATIAAGEETGHMIKVIERLADEMEYLAKNMQGLVSALTYPAVMIGVALVIVIGLMVYVVPQITEVFANMKQQLPLITRVLIASSNFLIDKGIYLLIALVLLVVLFLWKMRSSGRFVLRVHQRMLNLPFLGKIILYTQLGRWSRSFGMLLASGVPTLQALRIALQAVTNQHLRQAMQRVNEKVREGQALHLALGSEKSVPSFVMHMSYSGEASGNLDNMMLKISDYYIQFVRLNTETGIKLFEPLLIVVMGGLVMLIVLGILLPVFELNSLV